MLLILTTSLLRFSLKGCENVLFELRSALFLSIKVWGPVHTYPDKFENGNFFYGLAFRPPNTQSSENVL